MSGMAGILGSVEMDMRGASRPPAPPGGERKRSPVTVNGALCICAPFDGYQAADGFALTSHYEGIPNVLLEAMAYGCPAISVDCDAGPRDVIRDGEDGLLVAQDDPAALVTGLDRMLEDRALRERLASRAVEVVERFSPERIRRMWWGLFDELLEQRRQGRGEA